MSSLSDLVTGSLRRRLAWWLIPSLIMIVLVSAVWSYHRAMAAANHAYDRSLNTAIKGIAENIHATDGRILVDIPYSAMDFFDEEVQERIYYAVIGADGKTLTGYEDLHPPPSFTPRKGEPRMVDTQFGEHAIRLAIMSKRLYDPELQGGDTVTILFAETTEARTQLAFRLFLDSLRWQLLLIVSGLVLLMFAVTRTFRPLLALRQSISQRRADDLTPVPVNDVPTEVLPLIDAINNHIARLTKMLQARRRFLADAAHQIRTPLAVLGTQAEYGGRQSDVEEMRRTFAGMLDSIRGTRKMANQMLTLARAEQAGELSLERSPIDMVELVRDVAGDYAVLALKKSIDLAFDGAEAPMTVSGNATMLREMVANLADNALRYTPVDGHVTLSVNRLSGRVLLCVNDDGPGIPESEHEHVFQRFYRILGNSGSGSEGSGLGLSIVREIILAHGGTVQLRPGLTGRGLCVEVSLPAVSF